MKHSFSVNEKNALWVGLSGAVAWSFLGALNRFCHVDAFMVISVRGLVTALLLGLLRCSFKVHFTKGNLLGALGVAATGVLYNISIRMTSAANAIALQYAMTALVLVFTLLREKRRPLLREALTVTGVLSGVILCVLPGMGGGGTPGDLLALASAFTFALVFLAGKRPDADPLSYTYLGNLVSIPLFLLAADKTVSFADVGFMSAIGLCNLAGYICMGLAISKCSPVTAAVVANADPVLNPIWVFLFHGEFPGTFSLIGAVLVLATILLYQVISVKKPFSHSASR